MARANFSISGDKALAKAFSDFAGDADDELEASVHSGAEIIRDDASRRAPRQSGTLADHIERETLEKKAGAVEVGIGPSDKEAWYGFLVEFGVDPHTVERDLAQGLEVVDNAVFRASQDHPGFVGQPFLRPAYDENEDRALEEIGEELARRLGL